MKSGYKVPKPVKIIGYIIFGTLAVALFGWITMELWNWLLPSIFPGTITPVTYWQAIGILVLCKILFGSMGNGGSSSKRKHHKCKCEGGPSSEEDYKQCGKGHWKSKFRQKMEGMSDEEKEKIKEGLAQDAAAAEASENTEEHVSRPEKLNDEEDIKPDVG